MTPETLKISNNVTLVKGRISPNLMWTPMVSNTYILADNDEVIIFDPSFGHAMARKIEALQNRS